MYTFVSAKMRYISMGYAQFVYTFVYPVKKAVLGKSRT